MIKFCIYFGITLMMATTIFFSGSQVRAESNSSSYQSNSSVGFYGEYFFPEEVKPPVIPPIPNLEGNHEFPQTGSRESSLPLVGTFILLGYIIFKKNKKRSF